MQYIRKIIQILTSSPHTLMILLKKEKICLQHFNELTVGRGMISLGRCNSVSKSSVCTVCFAVSTNCRTFTVCERKKKKICMSDVLEVGRWYLQPHWK